MSFNLSQCGTVVCGIKTPFILRGDDLLTIIWQSLVKTIGKENIDNGDIIAVTEAVLALAQEDIVSKKDVAESIKKQLLGSETLIVLWPIFSRNRFAPILDCLALAMKGKKIILQLNAFVDEQGNNLFNREGTDLCNCRNLYVSTIAFVENDMPPTFIRAIFLSTKMNRSLSFFLISNS